VEVEKLKVALEKEGLQSTGAAMTEEAKVADNIAKQY